MTIFFVVVAESLLRRKDESNDETVETQNLSENQNQDHPHEESVKEQTRLKISACICITHGTNVHSVVNARAMSYSIRFTLYRKH